MPEADIAGHWAKQDIYGLIMNAAENAGIAVDSLTQKTLAPLDHFHARGLASTIDLADKLPVQEGDRLLDMGSGLGGPARYLSTRFNCSVMGIDLTEPFVDCAQKLTRHLALDDQVTFRQGDVRGLPFEPDTFDGAYSQHVTMNIDERGQFFAEAFRVLRPGGYFAVSEHGRGNGGAPHYPVPWSEDGTGSYLVEPEQTLAIMDGCGFSDIAVEETGEKYLDFYHKAARLAEQGQLPPIGLHLLMGENAPEKVINAGRNIAERRTRPVLIFARKPG